MLALGVHISRRGPDLGVVYRPIQLDRHQTAHQRQRRQLLCSAACQCDEFDQRRLEDIRNLVSDLETLNCCLVDDVSQSSSALLVAIIAATILATLSDYLDSPLLSFLTSTANKSETEEKPVEVVHHKDNSLLNRLLNCFSIKRNAPVLFGLQDNANELKCLHGLKALSILLLFISFKLIPMGRVPYSNRNKLTEFFNSPLSVFLRSSFLYEDVFLVISGTLATLSLLKSLENAGKYLWLKKILQRFLRLVLPLAIVLLFYAFIWEHLGTGPQWSSIVDKNADLCKQSFWKNLLFIQNFFPIEDMVRIFTTCRVLIQMNFSISVRHPHLSSSS